LRTGKEGLLPAPRKYPDELRERAVRRYREPPSRPTLQRQGEQPMVGMGLGEHHQQARSIDFDLLVKQFTALPDRTDELRRVLVERNLAAAPRLEHRATALSDVLFPVREPTAAGGQR
jgi:hypothetical protein